MYVYYNYVKLATMKRNTCTNINMNSFIIVCEITIELFVCFVSVCNAVKKVIKLRFLQNVLILKTGLKPNLFDNKTKTKLKI